MVVHGGEGVGMDVEAAAVDLYEPHAPLDQAARQQGTAAEGVVAVALDHFRLDLLELEGFERRAVHQRTRLRRAL